MSYSWKHRLADCFAAHPVVNRKALLLYKSLQEVLQLINPDEKAHTKKRNHHSKY